MGFGKCVTPAGIISGFSLREGRFLGKRAVPVTHIPKGSVEIITYNWHCASGETRCGSAGRGWLTFPTTKIEFNLSSFDTDDEKYLNLINKPAAENLKVQNLYCKPSLQVG